jgi:hypothetical protein
MLEEAVSVFHCIQMAFMTVATTECTAKLTVKP